MTVLLDTSVLVDHLRGREEARQALRRALSHGEPLTASVVTKVEVLAGMRASEEEATRTLFRAVEWIAVDDGIAERAGQMANRFLRSHSGVDPNDYIIAATAEQLEAQLWTRNLKHFPMFPHLTSPY
ncbi:type II toxin-antitoxin system VapC family toxin [Egibacter rhizosphaerae]|uniref:Ribonuclease VapC n=1 Tax=Egibacter rhizosphaerae TaxID=1670831 RepID=A0A411YG28_9ACTN|nr:type II toxin-antitoxin system VapC family toxin [Egibacter rhizosphaerae]QBI20224.1 type II toxin-antitoxin system VapC family toxin [Egibacter rhizosphaerae]